MWLKTMSESQDKTHVKLVSNVKPYLTRLKSVLTLRSRIHINRCEARYTKNKRTSACGQNKSLFQGVELCVCLKLGTSSATSVGVSIYQHVAAQ